VKEEKQQRSAWKLGLLASGAVVLGGLIAAGSSYFTARVQVHSQAQQARQEFLRSQREAFYAKIASDHTAFIKKIAECDPPPAPSGKVSAQYVQTQISSLDELINAINADAGNVVIVGSRQVIDSAGIIIDDDSTMREDCITLLQTATADGLNSQAYDDALNVISGDLDDFNLSNVYTKFLRDANNDVQS
jgi:hypothetical protein